MGWMWEHKSPCNDSGISSEVLCNESSGCLGVKHLYLSWQCCDNRPKGPTASSRWRRNSCDCMRLFITSCRRLNSRFSALWSCALWMWPQGAKHWNFNTPHSHHYSAPECRAFQTISEELWKAKASGNLQSPTCLSPKALAFPASGDISHSHSKGVVMLLAGGKKVSALMELKCVLTQFLQVFRRCWIGQLQPFHSSVLLLNVSISVRLMSASVAAVIFVACLHFSAGTAERFYVWQMARSYCIL